MRGCCQQVAASRPVHRALCRATLGSALDGRLQLRQCGLCAAMHATIDSSSGVSHPLAPISPCGSAPWLRLETLPHEAPARLDLSSVVPGDDGLQGSTQMQCVRQ